MVAKTSRRGAAAWILVVTVVVSPGAARAADKLDPARVAEIEGWLPERPEAAGRPIGDREWWGSLRALPSFEKALADARREASHPLPEQTDELFLEYSRTGNRTRWQSVASARRGRLSRLAMAECLENEGRFLPVIEALAAEICAERTWVMPAHDAKLANFEGKVVEIDLGSSALGWEMATIHRLLGDRLSAETRELIATNVRRRILDPFLAMAEGRQKSAWWMTTTNNWNSVCLAGVVGAALAADPDRRERAEIIAHAERYVGNFLKGFTPDGYCSEGLGYWNYGFGRFVTLSETIRRATGDRLELLARPEARKPARFGERIEIIGGVAPAFADCAVNARPAASTVAIASRRLGLEPPAYARIDLRRPSGSLAETLIDAQAQADPPRPPDPAAGDESGLRTWFDSAGILIGRPAPGSDCVMGVALKGGHNAEHHNHNDVGSYVVVLKDRAVLLDPGAETYTARTFSNRRYDSKLLNSFGHPVPVVAGQLQREGADRRARVLEAAFTDDADTLRLDLASAYLVAELKSLERAFVYDRSGLGRLTVTDRVAFTEPRAFGTALITRGEWKRLDDGRIRITDGPAALDVAVDAGGAELTIASETIEEDAPVKPTRIALDLARPASEATITLTITPVVKGHE